MFRFSFSHFCSALIGGALITSSLLAFPAPLATAFTYQGELKLGGSLVNNTADFQFTLFDALSGPNQVQSQNLRIESLESQLHSLQAIAEHLSLLESEARLAANRSESGHPIAIGLR